MNVKLMVERLSVLPEDLPVYVFNGDGLDFPDVKESIIEYNGQDIDCILLIAPEDDRLNEGRSMCFGAALELLKQGERMRRRGWNGRGIFIELQRPDEHSKMTHPYIFIDSTGLQTNNPDSPKNRVPWLASQTDMLAEDWEVANV